MIEISEAVRRIYERVDEAIFDAEIQLERDGERSGGESIAALIYALACEVSRDIMDDNMARHIIAIGLSHGQELADLRASIAVSMISTFRTVGDEYRRSLGVRYAKDA